MKIILLGDTHFELFNVYLADKIMKLESTKQSFLSHLHYFHHPVFLNMLTLRNSPKFFPDVNC